MRKSNELFMQSIHSKEDFAVLMIDIDLFKVINDTYGHQVGDVAITMVANSIKTSINTIDIAGRYGGEEFVVAISNKNYEVVEKIAQRIRTNVEKLVILNDDNQLTLEKSIEYADQALYEAKHTGRNKVVIRAL